jgi:hypothetical protein
VFCTSGLTTSFTGNSGIVESASITFSDTFSVNVVKSWNAALKSGSCTVIVRPRCMTTRSHQSYLHFSH